MQVCNTCGLAFDNVDQKGNCQGCAAEIAAAAPPARDAQLDAVQRQLQQQNAKHEQLVQSLQQQARQQQPQQQQPDLGEMNKKAWADPVGTMDAIATQRAQQASNQAAAAMMAETQDFVVNGAKQQARGNDPDEQADFDRLLPQIEQRIATFPPQFHRQAQLWRNTFMMLRGENVRELRTSEGAKTPAIRINDGPASPSVRPGPRQTKAEEPLSDDARMVARRMKITEPQMRQGMADLANQGDPGDASKPSSWDKYITFDGQTGRNAPKPAGARA